MLVTPHALTGLAIASLIPNPILSAPIALISHFVLDAIPHWQESQAPYSPTKATWIRLAIDLPITIFITAQIGLHISGGLLCALISTLPDLDTITRIFPKMLSLPFIERYWNWHSRIQRETTSLWGVLTQLGVIGLSLVVLL